MVKFLKSSNSPSQNGHGDVATAPLIPPLSSGNQGNAAQEFVTNFTTQQANDMLAALRFARGLESEFASVQNDGYCSSDGKSTTGTGLNFQAANAAITSYPANQSFPKNRRQQIIRCDYWMEEDELLGSLIDVKKKFAIMGFNIRTASVEKEQADTAELSKLLKRMTKKWNLQKIVEELLIDWFLKDTMILYWKLEVPNELLDEQTGDVDDTEPPAPEPRSKEELTPGLEDITSINPADCDWNNSYGQDILNVRIAVELRKKIQEAVNKSGIHRTVALEQLVNAGVQIKYIVAVIKGQEYVTLRKEDGDNWIVVTKARSKHGIAKPSMCSIFLSMETRKAISEGEFATSFLMKHFLLHATTGESITQGPLAGQRINWANPTRIDALMKALQNTAKTTRVVTDHTVKFNFIFPPKEMWNTEKYQNSESRMYNWAGVSVVLMTGQGGTNAGGVIGIKRLIADLKNAREKISLLLFEFFDKPEIREICVIPDDVDIKATFDENALKEPRQLLDEIKFMVGSGLGDPSIGVSELGRDSDTMKDSKRESIQENEEEGLWSPVYSEKTASQSGTKNGRPAGDGASVDEESRTQSPPALS